MDSSRDGIIANPGGGQANAFQITMQLNRVTVVASPGDSICLPGAIRGLDLVIINHGANNMQVFAAPGSTDTINDVAGSTGVSQMANSAVWYICTANNAWYTEGLASGFSSGFQTFSVADGLTAHPGGGQANAVPLTAMTNLFSTVATAGDSAILPASKAGMEITVINKTATSMNIFPASGETINALAANTALAVAATTATIFYCGTSGAGWWTK